jgi:hypothetical protein
MKAHLRRALRRKRDQQAEKLVRKIISGSNIPEIKSELDNISNYSSLLSVTESLSNREWMWPAVVTCICLTLVGILWSFRVSRTDISLTLDTASLRASLGDGWQIENAFHSSLMHFERLTEISAPNLGISIEPSSGDAWLELEGGQIALQTLELKGNALVEILSEDNAVDLYASRSPLVGRVSALGKVTVTAGPRYGEVSVHHSYDIGIPETIEFSVVDPKDVPTQISVHGPAKWSLPRLPYSQLSFAREEVSGAAQRALRSGITSGTIRFNDTSWPVLDLREGDLLRVNQTDSARIETHSDGGVMHVALNGFVGSVTVGDSETSRELAPSYLEYIYNRKSLVFLWSAIVFLWGLIWRMSKAILG